MRQKLYVKEKQNKTTDTKKLKQEENVEAMCHPSKFSKMPNKKGSNEAQEERKKTEKSEET